MAYSLLSIARILINLAAPLCVLSYIKVIVVQVQLVSQ